MFLVLHSHFSIPILVPDGPILFPDGFLFRSDGAPELASISEAINIAPLRGEGMMAWPGEEGVLDSLSLCERRAPDVSVFNQPERTLTTEAQSTQRLHREYPGVGRYRHDRHNSSAEPKNIEICGDGGAAPRLNVGIAGLAEQTQDAAKPTQDAAKPTQEAAKPTQDVAKPTQDVAKPTQDPAKSTQEAAKPTLDAAKPTEGAAQPGHGLTKLSQRVAMSAHGLAMGTHGVEKLISTAGG